MATRGVFPHIPVGPAFDRTVVFGPLPADASELWLRQVLAPIGPVISVELSPGLGGSLQARVTFPTTEMAQAAQLHFAQLFMAPQQQMPMQVPQDPYLKGPQPFSQPPMGRFPLAVNVDINSNHGIGRQRIGGQPSMGGQRHRGVELEPTHKNLYVLNLPLDATTDQLAALFGNYGPVVHCVILAMLDAQARRRGFIDMASPNSAKEAIEALNGFVWHGYPIEVSYAIVQRSGGPFEQANGRHVIKRNVPRNRFNTGPRRVPADAAVSPLASMRQPAMLGGAAGPSSGALGAAANGIVGYDGSPLNTAPGTFDPSMLGNFTDSQPQGYASAGPSEPQGTSADPRTLFVSGLDPVAVLDDDDLRNALEAYGPTQAVALSRDASGISRGFGVVTYMHEASAHKAKLNLDGKVINGRKVSAHYMPLNKLGSDVLPLSVNTSSTSSPAGASSGLPSALSVLDSGSIASSPEYHRTPSGYSMGGTPASIAPSLPGSTPGTSNGFGNTTFSTPQPLSSTGSHSEFPNYSLPAAPATDGAPLASTSSVRHAALAYPLAFSPDNWPSSANNKSFGLGRKPTLGSPSTAGNSAEVSSGLAEPFVPRSDSGSAVGSDGSQVTEAARPQDGSASKGFFLGSAFESPSVNNISPTTLKSNPGFSGGVFSSTGSRGPLDQGSFDYYAGDKAEAGPVPFPTGSASSSRPLSRASGTLGVTLGADMAASIAAAALAPPAALSHPNKAGPPTSAAGESLNSGTLSSRAGGAGAEVTPKLDGGAFPGSTHSTPLTRRGHGYGHAHMYNHLTRSAGPSGSIGSIGSVSHAGSTSALSAASWARTPQSSLSSLEQMSPAIASTLLKNSHPIAGGDSSGETYPSFGSGEHTFRLGMHSASGSSASSADPWGRGAWSSPQAVGGPYAAEIARLDRLRDSGNAGSGAGQEAGGPAGSSSDSSSVTESGAGHSALRSLHQGSPPYSAPRDATYRKLPLAPVGHEKSSSITSPRTRLSSGSNGGNGAPGSGRPLTYGSGNRTGSDAANTARTDLASAISGLNIST